MTRSVVLASGAALAFLALSAFGLLDPTEARADDGPVDPVAPPRAVERDTPSQLPSQLPSNAPSPMAVALSYENGLWGTAFEQGLRVKVPFHPNWGLVLRPMAIQDDANATYRADLGGRVELYGASPVFLNLVRVYGGGGVQVFDSVAGLGGAKPTVGGGGQFGFEFFYAPKTSFFIEIGGTSPAQGGFGGGGTALAGVTWYPFASSTPERQSASLAR